MATSNFLQYFTRTGKLTGYVQARPISLSIRARAGIRPPPIGDYFLCSPIQHPIYGSISVLLPATSGSAETTGMAIEKVELAVEKIERGMKTGVNTSYATGTRLPEGTPTSGYVLGPPSCAVAHLQVTSEYENLAAALRPMTGVPLKVAG